MEHLNCSVYLYESYKVQEIEIDNCNGVFSIGSATGVITIVLIDFIIGVQLNKHGIPSLSKVSEIFEIIISRTCAFAILVLAVSLICPLLLVAKIFKQICSLILKRRDKHFVEFLDSFDVFWSLEDNTSKSVINVLGVVESDSPDILAQNIKKHLRGIYSNNDTRKIFFSRKEEYGFYYWRRYGNADIDKYVEIVDLPNSDANLETLMSDLQNQAFPYEDEGLFKILITKQKVGNHYDATGEYGIIFRIHHSVGDGVALIEFLCQTLADKDKTCPVNMFSMPERNKQDSSKELMEMMKKLCEIPICFMNGIIRKPDESSLHGPALSGKKVFKWTEADESLLSKVKEIKDKDDQFNVSAVLLAALSSALQNFLKETNSSIPDDIAVALPVRFPKTSMDMELKLINDFSVTIFDLPIKSQSYIEDIKTRYKNLRKSPDPLTNFYFLKLVGATLPRFILQPLLYSSQATMVFSNMPGPQRISICGGNMLKSLVFFTPHKGTTGLNVTALCYGGVLRLAAMADAAIVPSSEDLGLILNGMVEEIHRLHTIYVL